MKNIVIMVILSVILLATVGCLQVIVPPQPQTTPVVEKSTIATPSTTTPATTTVVASSVQLPSYSGTISGREIELVLLEALGGTQPTGIIITYNNYNVEQMKAFFLDGDYSNLNACDSAAAAQAKVRSKIGLKAPTGIVNEGDWTYNIFFSQNSRGIYLWGIIVKDKSFRQIDAKRIASRIRME